MQQQIIELMRTKPKIDSAQEIRKRVDFIKEQLINSNLQTLVLGVSGGQDSTLVGKLCQLAIDELNSCVEQNNITNKYKFIALRQPYGEQLDEIDCQLALKFIAPDNVLTTNIKSMVDSCVLELNNQLKNTFNDQFSGQLKLEEISDFNKGNIKARCRMVMQYAIAGDFLGLVVGTDHSAENVTGFFTKYGDGGVDICPIFGLNKRQGRQLLKYLNCPEQLYMKVPTADLEDNKPQLSDEIALGVTYDEIDDYLEGKSVSEKAQKTIESWYFKSQHKRFMPKVPSI